MDKRVEKELGLEQIQYRDIAKSAGPLYLSCVVIIVLLALFAKTKIEEEQ